MSEMVNKAAIAVMQEWQKSKNPVGSYLDCEAIARAVIAAMREPADEMLEMGDPEASRLAWCSMIDEALK